MQEDTYAWKAVVVDQPCLKRPLKRSSNKMYKLTWYIAQYWHNATHPLTNMYYIKKSSYRKKHR